jgi:hypothetical protein
MKRLKKFNESLDYEVQEISKEEFDEYERRENRLCVDMTPIEVKTLFELFSKKTKIDDLYYLGYKIQSIKTPLNSKYKNQLVGGKSYYSPNFSFNTYYRKSPRNKYLTNLRIQIFEIPDEWFILKVRDAAHSDDRRDLKFYKIDQFEGVLEFLQPILNRLPDIDTELDEIKILLGRRLDTIENEWRKYSKEKMIRLYNAIRRI